MLELGVRAVLGSCCSRLMPPMPMVGVPSGLMPMFVVLLFLCVFLL